MDGLYKIIGAGLLSLPLVFGGCVKLELDIKKVEVTAYVEDDKELLQDEAYKFQKSIGANLDIFKVKEDSKFESEKIMVLEHKLYFGDSSAWSIGDTQKITIDSLIYDKEGNLINYDVTTEIVDINEDGIIDIIRIFTDSQEKGWKGWRYTNYRITNLPGPDSVVVGPLGPEAGNIWEEGGRVVPDELAIAPYQNLFDVFRENVKDYKNK